MQCKIYECAYDILRDKLMNMSINFWSKGQGQKLIQRCLLNSEQYNYIMWLCL